MLIFLPILVHRKSNKNHTNGFRPKKSIQKESIQVEKMRMRKTKKEQVWRYCYCYCYYYWK